MDETLSETGEEMEVGNTPEPKPAEKDFTAQKLLQELSGDDWGDSGHATSDLIPSERPEITIDKRNFQHGDDTLEYRRQQEEHI